MKYNLMQPVIIVSDTLNYELPIGALGYIVMIEPRVFFGIPYCVRVPSEQKEFWVPECDLDSASDRLAQESEEVIRESLIDFALKTKNKVLFDAQFEGTRHEVK